MPTFENDCTYSPFYKAAAITPSDTVDSTTRLAMDGIYIGGNGNLVCRLRGDSGNTTFTGLKQGSVYDLNIEYVLDTSTTCTNMIALRTWHAPVND